MNEYMRKILEAVLDTEDADLILLRWLISYHTQSFFDVESHDWVDTKREEMKATCRRKNIINDETENDLSDLEYAQKIYKYGQSMILLFANNKTARLSEYSVLLYIYTLAVRSSSKQNQYDTRNSFGKAIFQNIQNFCEKLTTKEEAIKNGTVQNGDFFRCSSVDRLIFALYLWIADFGILYLYNKEICQLSDSDLDQQADVDADRIYKLIYQLPSKIKYYYNNSEHSKETEIKIYEAFTNFISSMPTRAVPFAPSIITIFFNSLLPTKISRAEYPDFYWENLIRKIDFEGGVKKKNYKKQKQKIDFPEPDDSSFLKMLILPEDGFFIYDKNEPQMIDKRFIKYEWTNFCEIFQEIYQQAIKESIYFYRGWHRQKIDLNKYKINIPKDDIEYYENVISKYIKKSKIRIPTPEEFQTLGKNCRNYMIKVMRNHSFKFTYLYFEIFYVLAENKDLFSHSSESSVNTALSMIHLNAYTKWFDAVLLNNGIQFEFTKADYFFYLKILAIYERYVPFIKDISFVDSEILNKLIDKSMKKMKETDIDKKNIFLSMIQYFYKLAENKINIPELLNIFKVNSPGKSTEHDFDGFNPVYQWIKLLDDKTLNENFFEKIVNARP